jgi:transcription initiation factor TFIID TATA-box-binding protein
MKIANVVSTVTLNTPLDLAIIHERFPQTEIPYKKNWLKLRLKPDNTYIAFYKSGKFLITNKDPAQIKRIANRVVDLLGSGEIIVKITKIEIHNIVVNTKIQLNTSLERIIAKLDSKKSSFEPEQFSGLVYKDWGVSFLLFSNGSCVIAGLKHIEDARGIIEQFEKIIQ